MIKTTYQTPELRNANDEVVQEGAFGKNTALTNSTNDGWIDYVMNDLEALHNTIGDSAPTLDGNGHVVEPANLAIGDEDGVRLKTGYVKTSGGTVSGTLNVAQNLKMQDNQENVFGGFYVPASSATSQYLALYGGSSPASIDFGSALFLYPAGDGSFVLRAKSTDNSTTYDLKGNSNGTLTWRGGELAFRNSPAFIGTPTAPTPATADDSTKIATTAWARNALLSLTGGTMSGTARFSNTVGIMRNTDDSFLIIGGGSSYTTGGYLALSGKDRENTAAGAFELQARGTNGTSVLIGYPNGTLTWKGENVITEKTCTFLSSPIVYSNSPKTEYMWSNLTIGDNPASNRETSFVVLRDVNNNQIGALSKSVATSGLTSIRLYNMAWQASATSYYLGFFCTADDNVNFQCGTDNKCGLGTAAYRWKQLFAGTTTISTSDERLKDNITDIPDAVLDAWGEVNWYQYQFKNSIAEKGETKARIHTGAIAQRIESVFNAHGLDANKYGLLCYDEWQYEPAERDEDGNIIQEARPAGNRYSLRYEEALCMEAAYQRRRADRLEQRLEAIEQRLSALETL